MNKEQKAELVEEIAERLADAGAIFAVDYRGISVPQAAELRARLAESDATFKIVKNRLAKRAVQQAGTEGLEALFEGPTALAFVKGDPVSVAKAISTFGRQHQILTYKGGLMDGAPLDPEDFNVIARLPALDVLHGQLVGVAASPLTGLARGLGSMLSGLAVGLGQIQEQNLLGEAEEEPAGASDEVAEAAAEPAAPPEPEPAGNGAAGEASGGGVPASDEVAEEAAEPTAPPEPEPAGNGAEGEASGGGVGEASGGDDVDDDQESGDAGVEEND